MPLSFERRWSLDRRKDDKKEDKKDDKKDDKNKDKDKEKKNKKEKKKYKTKLERNESLDVYAVQSHATRNLQDAAAWRH
ncbi:protein PXR1-like [Lytechinus variegatus]|uniref:protein PXR1-like n=1 Tax=Lytechinus variegatus TaxID=7654 RepID=UPI001BB21836|nr:protein PXR1-like [Lytechinus variegatus]XP_041481433.1 protein PXR1-like [Lytechinus variegatus]